MLAFANIVVLLVGILQVNAMPWPLASRQGITALSLSEISSFRPYSFYANAVYCGASATLSWSCGPSCMANPSFKPTTSGGDGDATQFWYVGFDPTLNTVIVAHQGTDPSHLLPILADIDIIQEKLDKNLFPGVDSSVKVHSGFAEAQARAAPAVLKAVQQTLSAHAGSTVTVIGHSLGAAIALLDSVYLPLHIPGVKFKTIVYGLPRVGNKKFADYVDSHVDLKHISNKKDPVPIVPGRFLGFHHPSGEVHIQSSTTWESCPGQDNTNSKCTIGDVPNIFESNADDHLGPYDGITIGIC